MDHFDHSRQEFTPYGLTCELWTPTQMQRPDRHNEIEINLLNEGSLIYLLGGHKASVPPCRMAVFWAAVPHQIIERANTVPYFVVTIPLTRFLQWQLPRPIVTRILQGEMLFAPAEADTLDRALFARWVKDLQHSGDPEMERIVLLELEACLHRFARHIEQAEPEARAAALVLPGDVPTAVEQMAQFIAQHYTEPLSIETISGSVGLHPNYAMTLFRKTFGTTLTGYLTATRIAHAQRLLVMSESSVLDIALDSGFGSLSRFNTAFKAASGCSPRDYRRAHRAGFPQ